ncbi:MAG: DUF1707 domain-containing protein [Dermatophilaceae bacterium]
MSVDDPARPLQDADRAAAVAQLRGAAEDGRLDPHELDQRVERVRTARLVGELSAALDGLRSEPTGSTPMIWPTAQPAQAPAASSAHHTPSLPDPPGYRPDDRLSLTAGVASVKRGGRWVIPPYVRLQAGLAKVKLDCRQAEAVAPVIDIRVGIGAANVVLVLPPGWGVDTDRLGKGIGKVKVRVPRVAAEGCPTLVLGGQLGVGNLIAREANWVERRRDRRAGR